MDNHLKDMRVTLNNIYERLDENDIKKISMTKGMFAIVNKDFYSEVNKYRWYTSASQIEHIYAVTDIRGMRISLQRLVFHLANPNSDLALVKNVSFHNKCGLDCRIENLLGQLDRQAMARNRLKKRTSASKYKGLRKRLRGDGTITWLVTIRIEGGDLTLGSYEDEVFAAQVYDAAAHHFFGESAHPNFQGAPICISALEIVHFKFVRFCEKRDRAVRLPAKFDNFKKAAPEVDTTRQKAMDF